MQSYLDLIRQIRAEGAWQDNRTGIRTLAISGAMLKFDLAQGAPLLTVRKMATKSIAAELCGFLRGVTSAADFRALGAKIWDANANENKDWLANPYRAGVDDLGPVYGAQWRHWNGYKLLPRSSAQVDHALARGWRHTGLENDDQCLLHKSIDQLRECADKLVNNPGDRRILFHAWNPAVLDEVALPACHILYQFNANVAKRELSMCFFMRSIDVGLGLPYNAASATMLLTLMARLTGFTPRFLTWFGADTHIYENHTEFLDTQLARTPLAPPRLVIADRVPEFHRDGYQPEWLNRVEPVDFSFDGYEAHPALTAPMAV